MVDISNILSSLASTQSQFQPAIITSTATLVGAFFGASAAQYFSHRLSLKREREKYYKDVYQKLISPIIFDIFSYYDITTAPRKGHDIKLSVDEHKIKEKIYKHITNNIMYATPVLIDSYYGIKRDEFYDDMTGFYPDVREMRFLSLFLNESIIIIEKAQLSNQNFKKQLKKYRFNYYFWSILIIRQSDKFAATQLISEVVLFFSHNKSYSNSAFNKLLKLADPERPLKKIKRTFLKLQNRGFQYNEINEKKLAKLISKKGEERGKFLELLRNIDNREIFIYHSKQLIHVAKLFIITNLEFEYVNDTLRINFELKNNNDRFRNFSPDNFVLRKSDKVYRSQRDIPLFLDTENQDVTLLDYEARCVQLEYKIGYGNHLENEYYLCLLLEEQSHFICYF
ncbi:MULTISPECIES: hypothetical protein [Paenibacillus]|uniref:hypothetical protein n=1 Tax=Paenibacillus TaxID=44249 RepID=UPI0022B90B25|nr:hypothetical protein [Paenibacillus caseinilyticus]MCZ8520144.1 hypothetical protein [Paenibacillus caseinilyticus]